MKPTHVLYAYLLSLFFGSLALAIIFLSLEMFVICLLIAFITSLPFLGVFMLSNYFLEIHGKGYWAVQAIHVAITVIYFFIFTGESVGIMDDFPSFVLVPYFICGIGFQSFYYFREKKKVSGSGDIID